jgi:hypothetical protein
VFIKLFFLIIISLNLMSCGGGSTSAEEVVLNPPSYYETSEYNSQYALSTINASEIYSDGYSGHDVHVAVIDTGVDLDHPDLVNNIEADDSWDYFDNDSDANPNGQGASMSHGTHVAGIIAATKNDVGMHGVAYGAEILAYRAADSSGAFSSLAIENSIDKAILEDAKVINASFGGVGLDVSTANKWLLAHNNDIVSVHSAGNNGLANPDFDATLPNEAGYTALEDTLIAVVATDSNNTIASYSNQCGIAQNWCMAAPGTSIYSTVDTTDTTDANSDGYDTYSGTSMAAPHVSGAVAVLRSKWPSKTASEVVTILYDTATDLGATGIDSVYGRGLLNLNNAVYAQGVLNLYTASGVSYTLDDSNLLVSSIMGSALSQSLETAVFDKYKRDYYFNLDNAIQQPSAFKILDELRYLNTNVSIDLDADTNLSSEINTGSIQIQNKLNDLELVFSHKQKPDQVFAFNRQDKVSGLSNHYSPYNKSHLSQINNATVFNIINPGELTTSLGVVSGYVDLSNQHPISGVNLSILTEPVQGLSLQAQLSQLMEKETFLSNYFSGAYQTGVAKTNALNIIATSKLTDSLDFVAQLSRGETRVHSLNDSVVSNISDISSEGYSLSLIKHGLYSKNDTLFTSFKRPLSITSGDMTLRMADGLDLDDSIQFSDQTIGLTPTDRGNVLTLGYSTDYKKDIAMTLLFNHVNNPNHDSSIRSNNQVMMKMIKRF